MNKDKFAFDGISALTAEETQNINGGFWWFVAAAVVGVVVALVD